MGTTLFGGANMIGNNWICSEGYRTGMINKISSNGKFCKTYEGQMALEGITSNGDSTGANVWNFSIDNQWPKEKQEELVKKINDSMNSGQKVKVKYNKMYATWPWRSESSYLMQSIEPVNTKIAESNLENTSKYEADQFKAGVGNLEINLDGRNYLLRHDNSGKLKVVEMKEVQ